MNLFSKLKAWIKSWFQKESEKVLEPEPEKPVNPLCGCDLTKPLCDPPFTQDYMDTHAHSEECSIEPSTGLLVRYPVWVPTKGFWWMLSSVGTKHVWREGADLKARCHTTGGVRYHVRGFGKDEPKTGQAQPTLITAGNSTPYDGGRRYVIVECRTA